MKSTQIALFNAFMAVTAVILFLVVYNAKGDIIVASASVAIQCMIFAMSLMRNKASNALKPIAMAYMFASFVPVGAWLIMRGESPMLFLGWITVAVLLAGTATFASIANRNARGEHVPSLFWHCFPFVGASCVIPLLFRKCDASDGG